MRDYGKVAPQFWTGETGRRLRQSGRDCQLVALYLLTGPTANMTGLFHMPLPLLCHHTGLTKEGASKALRRVCEDGFAMWDEASEVIFVPSMARFQVGERLKPGDKRVKGISNELEKWRKCPFLKDFLAIYQEAFCLHEISPFEAPCKPLRSQEQEQEQEQEKEQELLASPKTKFTAPSVDEVGSYCQERSNTIDPQAFVDYYTARGWMLGKAKMKDWRAAVRTWERNQKQGDKVGQALSIDELDGWNPLDGGGE